MVSFLTAKVVRGLFLGDDDRSMPLLPFVRSSSARSPSSSSPSSPTLGFALVLLAGACATTGGAPGGHTRAGLPVPATGADAAPLPAASRYVTDPGG